MSSELLFRMKFEKKKRVFEDTGGLTYRYIDMWRGGTGMLHNAGTR